VDDFLITPFFSAISMLRHPVFFQFRIAMSSVHPDTIISGTVTRFANLRRHVLAISEIYSEKLFH